MGRKNQYKDTLATRVTKDGELLFGKLRDDGGLVVRYKIYYSESAWLVGRVHANGGETIERMCPSLDRAVEEVKKFVRKDMEASHKRDIEVKKRDIAFEVMREWRKLNHEIEVVCRLEEAEG